MGNRTKVEKWYDRQSFDVLVLIGLSPLILIGLILIVISVLEGG